MAGESHGTEGCICFVVCMYVCIVLFLNGTDQGCLSE